MAASLHKVPTPTERYNASAVKLLEEMLADAKAGEFESFFAVTFTGPGGYATWQSAGKDILAKLGALDVLKHELLSG